MDTTLLPSPPSPEPISAARADAGRCRNCGALPGSRFCGECGQAVYDGPLTFSKAAERLLQGVFEVDRGFLFTLRELTLRPGAAVQAYLAGRSSRYTNAIRYLVVIAAVTTLAIMATGMTPGADAFSSLTIEELSPSARRFVELFSLGMDQYFNLMTIAAVPFMAAATRLFFRKSGRSLAEHLVFNAFTYAHATLIFTAVVLLVAFAGRSELLNALHIPLFYAYWSWAAISFFGWSVWGGLMRTLVAGALATLVYTVVLMSALALYVGVTV